MYVGQMGADSEADFVAMMNGDISYYQAAETALAAETVSRELTPLQKIADNYPKYLLTLDELFGEMNYDGIHKINAIQWRLNPPTASPIPYFRIS